MESNKFKIKEVKTVSFLVLTFNKNNQNISNVVTMISKRWTAKKLMKLKDREKVTNLKWTKSKPLLASSKFQVRPTKNTNKKNLQYKNVNEEHNMWKHKDKTLPNNTLPATPLLRQLNSQDNQTLYLKATSKIKNENKSSMFRWNSWKRKRRHSCN